MTEPERIEKVRQAIMRYRELLDLLAARTEQAESRYAALFDSLDDDERMLPEKEHQRVVAIAALDNDDLEPLRRALLAAHFDLRDLEREFEETYNRIAPGEVDGD